MKYERWINLDGNPAKALESAREQFLQQGFKLTSLSPTSFEVTGPGMNNTRQNALRGVSKAYVSISGKELHVEAELRYARRMQRFVLFFPPALILGLMATFLVTLPGSKTVALASCIPQLLIWIPISLIWAPSIRRRTEKAIDTVMENAALIANE
ncbi:MAG TPA: hypothetical protein PLI09_06560 [Candidatus Hydrogenedentes bacterium]|nr:hypothetical protein [Candidatus Hydrogenedentota bacterium]